MIVKQQEVPVEQQQKKPVHLKTLLNRQARTESLSVTWVQLAGRC